MSSPTRSTRQAPRVDAPAKTSGRAAYTLDRRASDTAIGALLTSTMAHSRVTIDATAALALDGVLAVLHSAHDPGRYYCSCPHGGRPDMEVFAAEARFAGEIVGVVVAEDRPTLRRALALIVMSEEPLPAVLDVAHALDPDAPSAHLGFPSNLIEEIVVGDADDTIEQALAAAPHLFDRIYTVDAAPVGFMEPIAANAEWIDGVCHITSTTQCPTQTAATTADLLGVEGDQVVLHSVLLGGGFGGKEELHLEPIAALASRMLGGRAVSVEASRAQISRFRHRHSSQIRVRTGVDDDGRFTARSIEFIADAGAYFSHSPDISAAGAALAFVLYPSPVRRAVARILATNHTPGGAFRGYGGEQALFAVESQVDEIASALGIDPVTLRRMNMLSVGDIDPLWGWPIESFSLDRCLDVAEQAVAEQLVPPPVVANDGRLRGRGIAALVNVSSVSGPFGIDASTARCSIDSTGVVHITNGVVEMGQGNHTAFVALVEERFPELEVVLDDTDTIRSPDDPGVFASRGAYLSSGAVVMAAEALAAEAERWIGTPITSFTPEGMVTERGVVAWNDVGPLSAEATQHAPDNALAAGVQIAYVAVDPSTGQVEVEHFVSIHDVGALLQPDIAVSQVEGGVVQGIGYALTERASIGVDGITTTVGFLDHLIPTTFGTPSIDVRFVTDRPNPHSPLGAKGLGECPVMAVAPAIANAISDAVGVRCTQLPMSAERVMDGIEDRP